MSKKRLNLKIFGDVQGVNFRYYTQEAAQRFGLAGWVRNNPDGTVECETEGEEESLEKFLEWAKRGPPWARVERVEEKWGECKSEFNKFEIKF